MKRHHRGARPKKTQRDHVLVRITREAQHRLVDLSEATGDTMTTLASDILVDAIEIVDEIS
jgi:predicted DNA-binding protein